MGEENAKLALNAVREIKRAEEKVCRVPVGLWEFDLGLKVPKVEGVYEVNIIGGFEDIEEDCFGAVLELRHGDEFPHYVTLEKNILASERVKLIKRI